MMGLMESYATLCTIIMNGNNTPDKHSCVFKAQLDTTKAHGGNPGYHPALVQEHLEAQLVSKGYDTPEKQKTVVGNNLQTLKTASLKSAKGAYLGCLFLIMSNKRYKPASSMVLLS